MKLPRWLRRSTRKLPSPWRSLANGGQAADVHMTDPFPSPSWSDVATTARATARTIGLCQCVIKLAAPPYESHACQLLEGHTGRRWWQCTACGASWPGEAIV